jgi:hypothetical protein
MDYARFNYIAQPGDKGVRFIRQMGLTIIMVVGYRVIQTWYSEAEVPTLDKWILESRRSMYKFGKQSSSFDPTSQTEDMRTMKASSYGLKT